jgi:copper chaperone
MHHFSVPTMTCGGCLNAVGRALKSIDPQVRIEGDLQHREIAVTSRRSEADLLEALRRAGHPAEPLPAAADSAFAQR